MKKAKKEKMFEVKPAKAKMPKMVPIKKPKKMPKVKEGY
jgi:hypothetical protein